MADVKWVEIKACADHAAAAAELLVEVLQLEYSPLQAQLPRIWSLIWLADSPSQTLQQSESSVSQQRDAVFCLLQSSL